MHNHNYSEIMRRAWITRRKNGNDVPWNKGMRLPHLSNEHKKKIGESLLRSEKYRIAIKSKQRSEKLRISQLGERNRMNNPGTRMKMAKTRVGQFLKEKNSQWKGGISYEPYSLDWTRKLKQSIRERDRYTCQLCRMLQKTRALDVHHIDYNKKNCDDKNLVTLCHPCHMKTNTKRNYWIDYFSKL